MTDPVSEQAEDLTRHLSQALDKIVDLAVDDHADTVNPFEPLVTVVSARSRAACEHTTNQRWAMPTWGSPRIVGELPKIGIDVAKSTVEKYHPRTRNPSSPTWKAFLNNHVQDLVACDFFTVPTVTLRVLFVFVILAHERRRIVHFNVTEHPTAQWTAQQMVEAIPWDEALRYLLRDRDSIYGNVFHQRMKTMGLKEVTIAPESPWQNPYPERLIGSIRRECLNDVIVLHEQHLKRVLHSYVAYYHHWRTHRSLEMDTPLTQPVQGPERGNVHKVAEVGGMHHHYERRAV